MNGSTRGAFRGAVSTEIDKSDCGVVSHCAEFVDVDKNESTRGAFRGPSIKKSKGLIVASSPFVQNLLMSTCTSRRVGPSVGPSMQKYTGLIVALSPLVQISLMSI